MQQALEQASALTLTPISDAWIEHVHAVSRAHFGAADLEGAALAAAVDAVSRGYTIEREGLGRALERESNNTRSRVAELIARLKLYTVRDLPKIEVPLTELLLRGALPAASRWRVLDLGAGLGATSLGVARFAKRAGIERIDVQALDRDAEALRVFQRLSQDVVALDAAPIALKTSTADLTRVPSTISGERFELIVVGFVLNELWPELPESERPERAQQWLQALTHQLSDDGALIVLEPALREQTRQLQRVRDLIAASAAPLLFAPCTHDKPCPMLSNPRDWCHAQVPFPLPKRTAEIARSAGLRDHDLTFSYLTLRKQRVATNDAAHKEQIKPLHRVVSAPLSSKGKLELMTCSEGGLSRAMRLDRHRSERNQRWSELGRGAVVALPIVDDGGRVRVQADDDVEALWYWRR